MRLFVRNKTKYDPANAGKPLLFVEFADPRKFTIGQVKEEFKKKARAAKVDSLYHLHHDGSYKVLADDRTIGYYNVQNGAILETTSNPFWAAAIYYRLREVENNAAKNPGDPRVDRGLEQSTIQKYMALGILFNGNSPEQNQPPYFEELDQLFEHLTTAGKKPVHMSQQTLDTLQALKDEFDQTDIHERDPIGHFVHRQAGQLGLISADSEGIQDGDEQHPNNRSSNSAQRACSSEESSVAPLRGNSRATANGLGKGRGNGGNGNNEGRRPSRQGKGGRRPQRQERMCEDCEENIATQFCADCQPPLVLCDNCTAVLHRGATRRTHQLQDVSAAPPPPRDHSYTPKAYRTPFAMLVAFHRAYNEVPRKMSLSAEELKIRAQPLTNTDLEDKQGGKWFGGFDSLENTLMKNELVQKEAARTPKYSLMEQGQTLAERCSEFDFAVQNLLQAASVPTIPVMVARPVLKNRQVCLLVDSEEPLRDRFVRVARQRGLSVRTRKLPVGDFLWVLLPPGVNPDVAQDMPQQELVLPMIVERKTWDDLWSSLKSTRFASQVNRMKNCGLENLCYLVEGSPKDLRGRPGSEVEIFLQSKLDNLLLGDHFLVNRTGSWIKSVEWLCHLTSMGVESLQSEANCNLMTFSEFSKLGRAKKHNRGIVGETASAPGACTVWSASEFAEIIRSHSNGGPQLQSLQGLERKQNQFKTMRSLIIIHGLTQYNKQCHSLLDKSLADFLKNPQQPAQACVQKHLQGFTDQLIHQDVLQWYILWLQVFKGVMVRRTETEEETNEIVFNFRGMSGATGLAQPNNTGFSAPAEEERPSHNDLVFANDSQEEDTMIRQALRASQYEEDRPFYNGNKTLRLPSATCTSQPVGTAIVQPVKRTGNVAGVGLSTDSSFHFEAMSEEEQLTLALQLSKNECHDSSNQRSRSPVLDKPTAEVFHGRPNTPARPNPRASLSVINTVAHNELQALNEANELKEALRQSLEVAKTERCGWEAKDNEFKPDDDLQRVLEISRMEYESSRSPGKKDMIPGEENHTKVKVDNNNQVGLTTALRMSRVENDSSGPEAGSPEWEGIEEALQLSRMEYERCQGGMVSSENDDQKQCSEEQEVSNSNSSEKALKFALTDSSQMKEGGGKNSLEDTEENDKAVNNGKAMEVGEYNGNDDLNRALELSRLEYEQSQKSISAHDVVEMVDECEVGDGKLHNMGKDLNRSIDPEKALELSRMVHEERDQRTTSKQDLSTKVKVDITVVEDDSCSAITTNTNVNASKEPLTPKNTFILVDEGDDFVPSSLASEWDQTEQSLDHQSYSALDPNVASSGCSKDCAITIDSQDLADDFWQSNEPEVEEPVAVSEKCSSPTVKNSTMNDFTFALQLQEELNKELRLHGSKSTPEPHMVLGATSSDVTNQLSLYRQSQNQKYRSSYGKKDKSSPGFEFRRNVAAFACGKPVQIGIASPTRRPVHSQKNHKTVSRDMIRSSAVSYPSSCTEKERKQSQHASSGALFSPTPSSSQSCLEIDGEGTSRGTLPFSKPGLTSGQGSLSPMKSQSRMSEASYSSQCTDPTSEKFIGPTCGACGEKGHSRNSKACPQYYSEENVKKREEQSRKRKAKKEEEERDFQDRLGALAAQRLVIEDQSRVLGEQLEQLRRQSQNMADTQKKVEDAIIKRRRKR